MSFNLDKAIDLRCKCPHFRILIIGRANAGKTTLLKKVCNSIEDPEIFSPDGEKVRYCCFS
jgi:GTPase SAR1 family protein